MKNSCNKCAQRLEGSYKFCPECGNHLVKIESQNPEAETFKRGTVIRRRMGLSLVGIALVWLIVGLSIKNDWLHFASGLKASETQLELQLGKNTNVWANTTVSVRAKVNIPHDLLDSADVRLEMKTSKDAQWQLIESQSVRKSGVYVFSFTTGSIAKISQLRIAGFAGNRLIQTSRPKEMRNFKTPNNATSAGNGIYYRYFTDDEYNTISTPGCGNKCYALWVAAAKNTFTKVSIRDGDRSLSKNVTVILNEPGKYKKVVIPTTGKGRVFFSGTRAASSAEISKASTPPRNNLDEAPYNGDYNSALEEKCQTEAGHSGMTYQELVENNYEFYLERLEKLAAGSSSWSFLSISEQRKREEEYDSLKQTVRDYADEYKLCSEKYPYGFFTQFLDKY